MVSKATGILTGPRVRGWWWGVAVAVTLAEDEDEDEDEGKDGAEGEGTAFSLSWGWCARFDAGDRLGIVLICDGGVDISPV